MSTELEKCEQQAKRLPLHERAVLISRLIAGIDELAEQDLETLWISEASRRLEEYRQEQIPARLDGEVFARARIVLENMQ